MGDQIKKLAQRVLAFFKWLKDMIETILKLKSLWIAILGLGVAAVGVQNKQAIQDYFKEKPADIAAATKKEDIKLNDDQISQIIEQARKAARDEARKEIRDVVKVYHHEDLK